MISVAEAQQLVLSKAKPMAVIERSIDDALGQVLAADVASQFPLPLFDNSAMDGYAVWLSDCSTASAEHPIQLHIAGTISAGNAPEMALKQGHAMQILTGAMVPQGADAVIRQEDVILADDMITISRPVKPNENIRFRGEEAKRGDVLLPKGTRLNAAGIAVLASSGIETVKVHAKPRVGILATGSELVSRQSDLMPGKIFESNTHTLTAALRQMDIPISFCRHCADDKAELANSIAEGMETCDILLITGGVSVGEYDYVKELVTQAGIEQVFWRVKQKPGKPLYFGTSEDGQKLLFGLPGNPASVLVGFFEYVRPAMLRSMGADFPYLPTGRATLQNDFHKSNKLTHFLKGRLDSDGRVAILDRQGSHMMSSFAQANCLVIAPPEASELRKGDSVEIHLLPI